MNVPYVTVDAYGRVTSISNKVYTAQNTWRGIQDNLTSSSNTTESLSAKQGYLLANGDARDDTKLPLTGGTLSGSLWSGTTSDTAERQVGVASGSGTLYMYAQGESTENRGVFTANAAGTWANVITVDQNNAVTLYGNATTATSANGWNIVSSNELRTSKPASATTLYINYRFSDGTQGALVDGYRFCNGNGATTRVAASIFNTTRRGTGTPSGGADGDIYFQYS